MLPKGAQTTTVGLQTFCAPPQAERSSWLGPKLKMEGVHCPDVLMRVYHPSFLVEGGENVPNQSDRILRIDEVRHMIAACVRLPCPASTLHLHPNTKHCRAKFQLGVCMGLRDRVGGAQCQSVGREMRVGGGLGLKREGAVDWAE